jgi:hypothetical protein
MESIDGAKQKERRCGGSGNRALGWRSGPTQCDEHDIGSCGGRAGRAEPVCADLCLRNRRGARSRGDDGGYDDGGSGGRAKRAEPAGAAFCAA